MKASRWTGVNANIGSARHLVFTLLLMWGSPAASAEEAALVPPGGSYTYVGGSTQVNEMYASVESVVKEMNMFIRGIARRRLRRPNMPSPALELIVGPTTVTVARAGRSRVAAPRDGTPTTWRSRDGTFDVTHVLDGQSLLETINGKKSKSTNRFTLEADGVTLTVRTKIISSQLPGPVEFVMTYRRN